MSQDGRLTLYQIGPSGSVAATVAGLFDAFEVIKAGWLVAQLSGPDQSWQDYQDGLDRYARSTHLPSGLGASDLAAAYQPPGRLYFELGDCPLGRQVAEAVRDGIGEEVRGVYVPVAPGIEIGEHDLIDWSDEGELIARAFLSIRFFGYGTALQVSVFEEQVWQLPGIIDAKAKLEAALGPLEQCLLWSP